MTAANSRKQEGDILTSQSEDYLEVIAELQEKDHVARAKDIAERMGVTRGTVTSALKGLHEKGLINYQPYSHVTLTEAGEKVAADIIHRHKTLTRYLHEVLQLAPDKAEANACRAEHVLDSEVIDQMICFLEFIDKCPRTGEVWRRAFEEYCKTDGGESNCKECVGQCLAGIYSDEP